MRLPSLDQLDISEKRVLIRVDFDVPLDREGDVADDTKILLALPTIRYALGKKAKVILASHLGDPRGRCDARYTLEPVGRRLSEALSCEVFFPEDCLGDAVTKIAKDMFPGTLILLENLRFHKGEEWNDYAFAKRLASIAEVYVNEAFSVSDSAYASTVAVLQFFDSIAVGLGFKKEWESLDRLLRGGEPPFVAVLGGSDVEEKIVLMESLIQRADTFLLGGVVSNTFLKAMGGEVGRSEFDSASIYSALKILSSARARGLGLILPEDAVAVRGRTQAGLTADIHSFIIPTANVPHDCFIADIGPSTLEKYARTIETARTVFWCGPMGVCENPAFLKGTLGIAKSISNTDGYSYVAGSDTLRAIKQRGYSGKINHLTSGGKSPLQFIEGKTLPGLKALSERFA